ncbi:hypothetical protein E4656_12720 [Natronospirillum operosum]|uniref:Uncharacterized protein n=1 Tax=Natronospirillum operosum TaxID=2759953 RepID=A0A4Z0W9W7_9GAMM|nr:DUF6701 domain-containing protein [Natronospirillum operosum]TGG92336.1 hypothetical protein E4656_12720 [Natronospirillum operosum]
MFINVGGNVNPGNNAVINANLSVDGSVNTTNNATIDGGITIGGNLNLGNNAVIAGLVTVEGDANIGNNVQINGDLGANNINVGENSEINGNVEGNNINLSNNTVINGNVNASGSVNNNGTITGYVNAPTLNNNGTVVGSTCDQNVNVGPCADTDEELSVEPGAGTFVVPDGVTSITVEAWGAGGHGAEGTEQAGANALGGGGGGGGAMSRRHLSTTPGETFEYFVGDPDGPAGERASWLRRSGQSTLILRGVGGSDGAGATGGAGGQREDSIGVDRFSGGDGADGADYGGGGGSAAGINSAGNDAALEQGGTGPTGGGAGGDGATSDSAAMIGQLPGGGGGGGLICNNEPGCQDALPGSGANGQVRFYWETDDPLPEESLEYIELSFSSPALTCRAAEVTFRACATSDCGTLYTGEVNLTATSSNGGQWTGGADITFTENTARRLALTEAGTTTLGVTPISPTPEEGQVRCNGGTDCTLEFVDTALVLTGIDQEMTTLTAGQEYDGLFRLQAIETDNETGACGPALSGETQQVLWSATTVNPDTPYPGNPRSLQINGTPVETGSASSPATPTFDVSFDNDGLSTEAFTVQYDDAGRLELEAGLTIDVEAETLTLELIGDRELTFWPHRFLFADIYCEVNEAGDCHPGTDPADSDTVDNPEAAGPTGSPFAYAGAEFIATVEAHNAQGQITRNFGREGSPGFAASLTAELLLPDPDDGGNEPDLGGQTTLSASDFEDGTASVPLLWPEVGIVELSADLDSYLGQNNGPTDSATSEPVGRFIPYEFFVDWQGASLSSPNSSGDYIFQGQTFGWGAPPSVVLTPYSARPDSSEPLSGSITENYTGDFNKLPDTISDPDALLSLARHEDMSAGGPLVISPFEASMDSDLLQDWQRELLIDANQELTLSKVDTLPDDDQWPDPIALQFTYEEDAFKDSDGVCLRNGDGTCIGLTENINSGIELVYGRLTLRSAQGPVDRTLRLPVAVEIWRNDRFDVHGEAEGVLPDLAANQFTARDGNDDDIDDISITLPDPFSVGEADLAIDYSNSQPLRARIQGTDVPPYLQYPWPYGQDGNLEPGESGELVGPRAIASFGTYEGRPPMLFMLQQGR